MESEATFNLAWVAGVVGFFLPLLISFVKRSTWGTQTKRVFALITSAVAGIITVGVQLGLDFNQEFLPAIVLAVTDVYVVSSVTYQNFWKDTAIERGLESVGSPKVSNGVVPRTAPYDPLTVEQRREAGLPPE